METTPVVTNPEGEDLAGEGAGSPPVQWLVINLDRSPERLAGMAHDLAALNIGFTRVPAIDGQTLPLSLQGIDARLYRRSWGHRLQSGEVGCYLSHLRAVRMMLESPFRYAMVLEDDAVVTPDAVKLVSLLTHPNAPDDWDLVKFEAHREKAGLPIRTVSGRFRLCALPTRTRGAAAYLVNRTAAEALLGHLLPMRAPYDHAFDRSWALGIRVRAILPVPIGTATGRSTIPRTDNARRTTFSALWRGNTKVMQFLSGLHAWIDPRHPLPWPSIGPPKGRRLFEMIEQAIVDHV